MPITYTNTPQTKARRRVFSPHVPLSNSESEDDSHSSASEPTATTPSEASAGLTEKDVPFALPDEMLFLEEKKNRGQEKVKLLGLVMLSLRRMRALPRMQT